MHALPDLLRAAQEGIVFSFVHGMEVMRQMGVDINVIRAGNANMFLSPIFRETLASVSGAVIELYDTDGAAGAAKAAGIGLTFMPPRKKRSVHCRKSRWWNRIMYREHNTNKRTSAGTV